MHSCEMCDNPAEIMTKKADGSLDKLCAECDTLVYGESDKATAGKTNAPPQGAATSALPPALDGVTIGALDGAESEDLNG